MVRNVARTAAAIAAGDLAQRVPLSGSGDEFDRVAETINDMLDRIARLMDGVRQVSNAIAHDLRTPIARARARLEDAAMHAASRTELQAGIDRAVADLDGVTAVFEALLRIAEIEAGARRSAFAVVELSACWTIWPSSIRRVAEEHGLVLQRLPGRPIRLNGDRQMLQQAVANLLDNAIKFSRPGETVQLSAAAAGGVVRIVGARPGHRHGAGRTGARLRAVLPRRERAQHPGLRAWAVAGAGGGAAAWRPARARSG